MINIMAVDDELPALRMAESVLRSFDDVHICGLFHDAEQLLERMLTTETDIVFIDMKMPGMHGLELAGRIQENRPDVAIVFITAYDDYAVYAFETEALDYVMKPMTAERIRKTLDRFSKRRGIERSYAQPKRLTVQSFGRFSLETGKGDNLKFRRAKTEELLAFLLHHRGQPIAKANIMEALWGDRDAERAQSMLYTTVYQLRKELETFGLFDVIEQTRAGGGLCRLLWSPEQWDYEEFEQAYRRCMDGNDVAEAKRAVELYRDGYLAENDYLWAEERRGELELKFIDLLEHIADYEVRQYRFEFALPYLQKWVELQPYTKRVHAKIIALHLMMSNGEAAAAHERIVGNLFAVDLGVMPLIDMKTLSLDPRSAF
ncbi:hypothetical protein Back11_58900 [Paenibacillus baekrokdamisoli]|uniref:Uncharacterized protein n=1 Tax=Paenibacillus baekrokdamisoli TaxID=1712516 RepID=A0A3G9J864_9BACL|nr:response regulator [Paenibacillus baekrokdamisoli]MBB3071422.1 two-component SAPR family response regulator [Paenibacillus baekrokdamisoli]BBH24545.1 hypothetical protein Back11_58900 [Paenibacillus baekrokdamisoli]